MNPKAYKYTREHEWIYLEPAANGRVGITDYLQAQLVDIVGLDLPAPGTQVDQSEKVGEVESRKVVSDLFTPVSGKVLEVNQAAIDKPQLVNQDPYGNGWLFRLHLSKPSELDVLMTSDEYDELEAKLREESSR